MISLINPLKQPSGKSNTAKQFLSSGPSYWNDYMSPLRLNKNTNNIGEKETLSQVTSFFWSFSIPQISKDELPMMLASKIKV